LPNNDRGIQRQQGDPISLLLFLQNKESRLKTINKETEYEGVNWIHLAQDKVQWRAHVNTVMNLQLP
jgi:hypothetical protein